MPSARWDMDRTSGQSTPGVPARFGGWLPGADLFDAAGHGMAAAEAVQVDPQQRLALEAFSLAWPEAQVLDLYL